MGVGERESGRRDRERRERRERTAACERERERPTNNYFYFKNITIARICHFQYHKDKKEKIENFNEYKKQEENIKKSCFEKTKIFF